VPLVAAFESLEIDGSSEGTFWQCAKSIENMVTLLVKKSIKIPPGGLEQNDPPSRHLRLLGAPWVAAKRLPRILPLLIGTPRLVTLRRLLTSQ
jgi:hypothetical protein